MNFFLVCCLLCSVMLSCSVQKQIVKSAGKIVLDNAALKAAHVGISVYEPATRKFLYQYQSDKYFVPASNTKIATCYAAMKYLGDSLPGIYYRYQGEELLVFPTGDPSFLHPHFRDQKVFQFLRNTGKPIYINTAHWQDDPWGSGWSWNDYEAAYMAERSVMPVYGNVVRFDSSLGRLRIVPSFFSSIQKDSAANWDSFITRIDRGLTDNNFRVRGGAPKNAVIETSFFTDNGSILFDLLSDTLQQPVHKTNYYFEKDDGNKILRSQPLDSLLKPMMHNSDNFFAEQGLMMVSQQLLGVMNDAKIIDTILKTDLKGLPHKPRWADGSGLSRYNLFTPNSIVYLLDMMRKEFGMERLQNIFPTGNEGTLTNYYKSDSGFVYAKTGTLGGVVALSGYIYTSGKRLLIFSVLVNNHQASATEVRRSIEAFIRQMRAQY